MSAAYENVVAGRLKLKGRPLEVKLHGGVCGSGMISKKAKNKKKRHAGRLLPRLSESETGGNTLPSADNAERINGEGPDDGSRLPSAYDDRLTPAEAVSPADGEDRIGKAGEDGQEVAPRSGPGVQPIPGESQRTLRHS